MGKTFKKKTLNDELISINGINSNKMKDSTNFILRIENTESNTNRSLKIVSNSDLESLEQHEMIEKIRSEERRVGKECRL